MAIDANPFIARYDSTRSTPTRKQASQCFMIALRFLSLIICNTSQFDQSSIVIVLPIPVLSKNRLVYPMITLTPASQKGHFITCTARNKFTSLWRWRSSIMSRFTRRKIVSIPVLLLSNHNVLMCKVPQRLNSSDKDLPWFIPPFWASVLLPVFLSAQCVHPPTPEFETRTTTSLKIYIAWQVGLGSWLFGSLSALQTAGPQPRTASSPRNLQTNQIYISP